MKLGAYMRLTCSFGKRFCHDSNTSFALSVYQGRNIKVKILLVCLLNTPSHFSHVMNGKGDRLLYWSSGQAFSRKPIQISAHSLIYHTSFYLVQFSQVPIEHDLVAPNQLDFLLD